MSSRGAQQALVPGRMVIILNQRSGLPELGVVCGSPAAAANIGTSSGLGSKSSGFGGLQPSSSSSSSAAPPPGDSSSSAAVLQVTLLPQLQLLQVTLLPQLQLLQVTLLPQLQLLQVTLSRPDC